MSKSYRGWAEVEDWGQRGIRRQHKRKSESDWKREAVREMADLIYVIVEEYEPDDVDYVIGEVLDHWYESKSDALLALSEIAEEVDADYALGDESFLAPPERGIERDTYYIKELYRG